jgi:hypothetical protein
MIWCGRFVDLEIYILAYYLKNIFLVFAAIAIIGVFPASINTGFAAPKAKSSCSGALVNIEIIRELARLRIAISTTESRAFRPVAEKLWAGKLREAELALNISASELKELIKKEVLVQSSINAREARKKERAKKADMPESQTGDCADKGFVANANIGDACVTNQGSLFTLVEHPKLGRAWKDPDGMVWGKSLGRAKHHQGPVDSKGIITDSPAVQMCKAVGGELPTKKDYERFQKYFGLKPDESLTDEGLAEMKSLFPDMKGAWFWSSSVYPDSPDSAFGFSGVNGGIAYYYRTNNNYSVVCVAH